MKVRFKRAVTVTGYGSFRAGDEADIDEINVAKLGGFIDILKEDVAKVDIVSDKKEFDNKDFYKKRNKGE